MFSKGLIQFKKNQLTTMAREMVKKDLTVIPLLDSYMGNNFSRPIHLWEEDDDVIAVPRGYFLSTIKKRFDPEFCFSYSMGSSSLKETKPIQYRPGQKELIDACVSQLRSGDFGGVIVEAKTGAGKTVLTLDIARQLGHKTLVVVHNTVLLDQWVKEIKKIMGWSVGVIYGDVCDVKNNDVCVGIVHSLSMKKYPKEFYDEFGTIIFDECLSGDTLIATPSGPVRIEDINVGQHVLTPSGVAKVKAKRKTNKMAYRYTTKHGIELVASYDHPVLTSEPRFKDERFSDKKSRKVIKKIGDSKNLVLKEMPDINVKECLFSRLIGWFIADGTMGNGYIQFAFRTGEKTKTVSSLLSQLKIDFTLRSNKRGDDIIYIGRKFFDVFYSLGFRPGRKSESVDIPKTDELCPINVLIGLFDGDGYISVPNVGISFASENLTRNVHNLLNSIGVVSSIRSYSGSNDRCLDRHVILISGVKSIRRFNKLVGFTLESKRKKLIDILEKSKTKISKNNVTKIVDSKPVGSMDLYDIEIDDEERLFFANGVVVHNCHLDGSAEFYKALIKFSAQYLIGATGTLKRRDKTEKLILHSIGPVVSAMETVKVLKPTVYFIDTKYLWGIEDGNIRTSDERNKSIVDNVCRAVGAGRHVLVLTDRVSHAEVLYRNLVSRLVPHDVRVGIMLGDTESALRDHHQSATVLVATYQLISVGFNNPRLDTLVFAAPPQSLEQSVGRILRVLPGKKDPVVLDFVDPVKNYRASAIDRLEFYRSKGWKTVGDGCTGEG